jgi:chemotaxis protein histidine kinase CheA
MTGLLAGMRGMLGHAMRGDGKVLMVLDLPELIASVYRMTDLIA